MFDGVGLGLMRSVLAVGVQALSLVDVVRV
jgi:hypothetical protein